MGILSIGKNHSASTSGMNAFLKSDNTAHLINEIKNALFPSLTTHGKKEEAFLSGLTKESQGLVKDVTSFFSKIITELALDADSPLLRALGITAAFNAFWKSLGIKKSIANGYQSVEQIQGRSPINGEKAEAAAQGWTLSLVIEKCQQAMDKMKFFNAVSNRSQTPITSALGLFSGIMAVVQGVRLYKQGRFFSRLDEGRHPKKLSDPQVKEEELYDELQKYVNFLEGELKVKEGKNSPKECLKEVLSEGIKGLKKITDSLKMPSLSKKQAEVVLRKLLSESELVEKGQALKMKKLEIKQEETLGNFIGNECLKMLKKTGEPLSSRLQDKDISVRQTAAQEAKLVVQKAREKSKEKLIVGAILILCFSVSFILAFFIPHIGVLLFVATIVPLLINGVFLILDVRALREALAKGEIGKYDMKMLILSSVVCIASVIAAITLTILGGFTLFSLTLLIIDILWIGVNGYTLHRLRMHTVENQEKNLTLELFQKALNGKTPDPEGVKRLFSRLKEEDRNGVRHKIWNIHTKPHGGKLVFERELSLDKNHDFGAEFFALNPLDEKVKTAAEKYRLKKIKIAKKIQEEQTLHREKLKQSLTALLAI